LRCSFLQIFLQHAVKGVYLAKDLTGTLAPLDGYPINFGFIGTVGDVRLKVNKTWSNVLYPDIFVCKSVVQVIDTVLY
jgi:hypothetical protein